MEAKQKAFSASRVIPAVIMVVFAAIIVILDPFYLGIAFVILGVLAQIEIRPAYQKIDAKPYFLAYLTPAALFALWVTVGPFDFFFPIVILSLLVMALNFAGQKLSRLKMTFSAVLYPGVPMFALAALCVDQTYGILANKALIQSCIVIVIGCVVISDIAAMVVGRKIGKRKLCPAISPGKTVAGLVAQLIAAPSAALGIWFAVRAWIFSEFPLGDVLFIGFLCGPLAVIGDLFASLIKRKAGIKDFGKTLGGHGGILDRFDGMSIATLFAVIWFVSWQPFYFL